MPTISMFYGIIIRMYYIDHNPPHIHVFYESYSAKFNLDGNLIEGELPNKQTKLVKAWIEIHIEEIKANWKLAKNSEKLFKIKPLN